MTVRTDLNAVRPGVDYVWWEWPERPPRDYGPRAPRDPDDFVLPSPRPRRVTALEVVMLPVAGPRVRVRAHEPMRFRRPWPGDPMDGVEAVCIDDDGPVGPVTTAKPGDEIYLRDIGPRWDSADWPAKWRRDHEHRRAVAEADRRIRDAGLLWSPADKALGMATVCRRALVELLDKVADLGRWVEELHDERDRTLAAVDDEHVAELIATVKGYFGTVHREAEDEREARDHVMSAVEEHERNVTVPLGVPGTDITEAS